MGRVSSEEPMEIEQSSPAGAFVATHEAMATSFRISVLGEKASYARQASREAFAAIDRMETLMSRFREGSDVHRMRAALPGEIINISQETWECLLRSFEVMDATGGMFDVFVGDLMDRARTGDPAVGFDPKVPSEHGICPLQLDPQHPRVEMLRPGVAIDFGAIGKGYAVDQVRGLFHDWEIGNFLLSGGGSSVLAVGRGETGRGWGANLRGDAFTLEVRLENCAVGGSGQSVNEGHILNLAKGDHYPHHRVWVMADDAATADALSTAFFVMGTDRIRDVILRSQRELLVVLEANSPGEPVILANGSRFRAMLPPVPAL